MLKLRIPYFFLITFSMLTINQIFKKTYFSYETISHVGNADKFYLKRTYLIVLNTGLKNVNN